MRGVLGAALVVALATGGNAATFLFRNRCPFVVNLYDNRNTVDIPSFDGVQVEASGPGLMWRHGANPEATLAEVTVDQGGVWYDISVIPPGTGNCTSFERCRAAAEGRRGFNVAMAMVPLSNINNASCRPITCLSDRCDDAFLYPYDNLKVHNCPNTTDFVVYFCPSGIVGTVTPPDPATSPPPPTMAPINDLPAPDGATPGRTAPPRSQSTNGNGDGGANGNNNAPSAPPLAPVPDPPPTPSPTPAPYVPAEFEYRGAQAGNVRGWYNRVTDPRTCAPVQRVEVNNPVGPLSEEVSLVFRGPMEIYNIAVFGGAPDAWHRMSWYTRGGQSENLVFLTNKNIDWFRQRSYGPQIFASSDGNGTSTSSVPFLGTLADAADASRDGAGPGIDTGVEVNIMTGQRCGDNDCLGDNDGPFNYRGWGGDRKLFVTRVSMPMSGVRPNMPAIWMLNAQTLYTGQYGCNCRGMGAAGGCGELDIAEVIQEPGTAQDRITTHYYFYDGSVRNPPGGDNFASRPINRIATYITIIDSTVRGGLIKILEIDDGTFDFGARQLSNRLAQDWING